MEGRSRSGGLIRGNAKEEKEKEEATITNRKRAAKNKTNALSRGAIGVYYMWV
jgi:hypothetical protein